MLSCFPLRADLDFTVNDRLYLRVVIALFIAELYVQDRNDQRHGAQSDGCDSSCSAGTRHGFHACSFCSKAIIILNELSSGEIYNSNLYATSQLIYIYINYMARKLKK